MCPFSSLLILPSIPPPAPLHSIVLLHIILYIVRLAMAPLLTQLRSNRDKYRESYIIAYNYPLLNPTL